MADLTPRQQQIIDVAMQLIADGGIQQLTMNNIALQIGFSEPAIYRHFKSKKDILLTILSQFKRRSEFQAKQAQFFDSSGLILLETIFLEYIGLFTKSPHLASVIFAEESFRGESEVLDEMFSIMNLVHKTISDVIGRAQTKAEIRDGISSENLAFTLLGSLRLLVKHWAMSGYAFDLQQKGADVWNSWKTLLAP
jgi:AcrR family transcriptional regulator